MDGAIKYRHLREDVLQRRKKRTKNNKHHNITRTKCANKNLEAMEIMTN